MQAKREPEFRSTELGRTTVAIEVRANDRKYVYRSRRIDGKVVREYVSGGKEAAVAAEIDRLKGDERAAVDALRRKEFVRIHDIGGLVENSSQAFEAEHIPGAVSLPHRTMKDVTTGKLDKASLVVTYCDAIGCNASTKGALNMTRLGFRVKELMGGLDWWKRDGQPTEGAAVATNAGTDCGCR